MTFFGMFPLLNVIRELFDISQSWQNSSQCCPFSSWSYGTISLLLHPRQVDLTRSVVLSLLMYFKNLPPRDSRSFFFFCFAFLHNSLSSREGTFFFSFFTIGPFLFFLL